MKILADWFPVEEEGAWALHLELEIESPGSAFVPRTTSWYALVSADYPYGEIRFHPAVEDGIRRTFPHQTFNGTISDNGLWRSGFLCLSYPDRSLRRAASRQSPKTATGRLRWNVIRALNWLEEAAAGTLRRDGDDFEHPNFRQLSKFRVAYQESRENHLQVTDSGDWGYVDFAVFPKGGSKLFIHTVSNRRLEVQQQPDWGDRLRTCDVQYRGVWISLKETPALKPWQAPQTWQELRECCFDQGIDLDVILQLSLDKIRDGARHFLSFTYPIPEKVGETGVQMHWQTLELPSLSTQKSQQGGFRLGSIGHWRSDRASGFANSEKLKWCSSRNWAPMEVNSRGRLPKGLESRRVLLVGCGALGCSVAEMLVRAGLRELKLVDGDDFQVGNTSRHTLGIESVGECKAHALANKMRLASPHVSVESIEAWFETTSAASVQLFAWADLVIDCTGEDGVIYAASQLAGSRTDVDFFSISISAAARQGYLFWSNAGPWNDAFQKALHPWLAKPRVGNQTSELVREGIGCWHPVFPGRSDDIWLMSAAMTKSLIDRLSSESPPTNGLTVFEQCFDSEGHFVGVTVATPAAAEREQAA